MLMWTENQNYLASKSLKKTNQEDIAFFVYVSLKNFLQRFISIVLHFQLIAQEQK